MTLVQKPLAEAERRGLIARDHQHIAPTPLGQRFLNDLQAIFLPAASATDTAETAPRPVKLVRVKP
jgi:oxygen-independent coproporphyrinogen-3 oxidase